MNEFCSKIGAFRQKLTPKPKGKVLFTLLLSLLTGLEIALAVQIVSTQSLRQAFFWVTTGTRQLLWSTLFFFLLVGALSFLFHNLFVGGVVIAVPAVLLAFVNYFKILITNVPLSISELGLASRVGNIAALNADSITFSRNSVLAILMTLLWLGILFFLQKPLRIKWLMSLIPGGIFALLFLLVMVVFPEQLIFKPLGASLTVTMSQSRANTACGEALGLWRGLLFHQTALPAEDFSEEAMAADLEEMKQIIAADAAANPAEKKTAPGVKPNVILILSESFFDVTKLPGVTYEGDPLRNFHALQEESVSGTFHTRTLGYGTCNIELEILTGVNSALFSQPTNLYYQDGETLAKFSPIPQILQDNGYYTAMMHTFNDQIYHRAPFFSGMGFDDLYFSGDFAGIDPQAAAAPDYYTYLENKLSGGAYSDAYLSDLITMRYEQKKDDGPVFLYGISMENHSPYSDQKYMGKYEFPMTAPALTREAHGALSAVTQGIANADAALRQLTDYFSQQEEPTIIVFFGDHRPGLGLTDNTSIYSQLGLCTSAKAGEWTAEEISSLYSTDYLIWANDKTLLPQEPGTRRDTSSNFLGLDLLDATGVEEPLFWQYLRPLSRNTAIYADEYYLPKTGDATFSHTLSPAENHQYDLMRRALYDGYFGKMYLTEALADHS
ncbi:MAG: LTA synthase family protein [Oscillospiraceae bacterium]